MIYPVVLEKLYENMDEATVGQWLFSSGDKVCKGDILVQLIATTDVRVKLQHRPMAFWRRF